MNIVRTIMIEAYLKGCDAAIKMNYHVYLEWNSLAFIGQCNFFLPTLDTDKVYVVDGKTITIITDNLALHGKRLSVRERAKLDKSRFRQAGNDFLEFFREHKAFDIRSRYSRRSACFAEPLYCFTMC